MTKVIFEPVKSSLSSKNWKSYFVDNLIKSKFYLFLLLTITTGGISIGRIMIPGQIPPAHARASGVVGIVIQNIPRQFQFYHGQALRLICTGVGYGSAGDHIAYFYRRSGNEWQSLRPLSIPFGKAITTSSFNKGNYYYIIDSGPAGKKEGTFRVR